ncbi:MAG: YhgE/Pip domain-containing protein, partial [Adlercreutzia sp.]
EFTDYDAAMNELKSGRAYAAYVIPEHFTVDLLTITTGSFTQPKIEYYVNEKSGPVAPKITDTGATTLDETINSTFVATVSDVVVKTIDEKVNEGRESTKEMQSKAAQKISEAVAATGEVRRVLADLGDASKAAKDKAASAKETLSKASAGIDAADESRPDGETATTMQKTLSSPPALPAACRPDDITQASNDATRPPRLTAAFGEYQGKIQAALAQGSAAVRRAASWRLRCARGPPPCPPAAASAPPWRLWPTPWTSAPGRPRRPWTR